MMVASKTLVEFSDASRNFVVCDVNLHKGLCAIIMLSDFQANGSKKFSKPTVFSIKHINSLVQKAQRVSIFEAHPLMTFSDDHIKREKGIKWIEKRNANLEKYGHFFTNDIVDQYLYGGGIGEFIEEEIKSSSKIKNKGSIYNALNKYIAHSCSYNSFLPCKYTNCGHNSQVKAKRGRVNQIGIASPGVTEENKANIAKIVKKHLQSDTKFSISSILASYKDEYENLHVTKNDGDKIRIPFADEECLSESQLRYHINQNLSYKAKMIAIHGNTAYLKDHQPRSGSARDGVIGATYRYEIDATLLDVYILDPLNRSGYTCGRVVLTLVVDTYSTMIVGMHVGLSAPSWESTSQALINTFSDKVKFADQFGLKLDPGDWPAHHFCTQITGDNGTELKQALLESILNSEIGVETFNFTPVFRGDLKGVIESKFKVLNDMKVHNLEGSVFKKTPRDEQHPSNRATYDLNDIKREIIKSIIVYNKSANRSFLAGLDDYDGKADLSPQGIFLSSLKRDMFGGNDARELSQAELHWALLPEETATVREDGIYLSGVKYESLEKDLMPLFIEAKQRGRFKIPVKKIRSSFRTIWHKTHQGEIISLTVAQNSFAHRLPDFSWELINHVKAIHAESKKANAQNKAKIRADLENKDQSNKNLERDHPTIGVNKSMPVGINARKNDVINRENKEREEHHASIFSPNQSSTQEADDDSNYDPELQDIDIDDIFKEE